MLVMFRDCSRDLDRRIYTEVRSIYDLASQRVWLYIAFACALVLRSHECSRERSLVCATLCHESTLEASRVMQGSRSGDIYCVIDVGGWTKWARWVLAYSRNSRCIASCMLLAAENGATCCRSLYSVRCSCYDIEDFRHISPCGWN